MKTKNKAGQNERNELMVFNAENQKRRMEFVEFWPKRKMLILLNFFWISINIMIGKGGI